jgi:hypothetical protein
MKKSLTFLLGTLMVAGVLAGASTSTNSVAKKGNTIQPVMHGAPGMPLCPQCTGGGNSGGNSGK